MAEPRLEPPAVTLPEGPAFDAEGNLYFVDVLGWGKVFKVTVADKKLETIYNDRRSIFTSIDIHKDGRLFICDMSGGRIIAMNSDGTGMTEIVKGYNGKRISPDDMIFDSKGDIYFTDYQGTRRNPTGRVFRLSSDFQTIDLIADGLSGPIGISQAPGERRLWIGEYTGNTLVALDLAEDGTALTPGNGVVRVYPFDGRYGADSNAVDVEGNVYQVVGSEGKFVIFNENGAAVGQVVTPVRDDISKNPTTANLAFQPGTDHAFFPAGGRESPYIFTFQGLAKA